MIRIPTLAATGAVLVLTTIGVDAQNLSQYREFKLGSTLASVQKISGASAGDVK